MSFKDIFGSFDLDWLTDDALIFIWVTNAMGTRVSIKMAELGWQEKEQLVWNKYDQNNKPLFRAGQYMRHVNEKCYMFKRAIPIRPLEKFYHEQ